MTPTMPMTVPFDPVSCGRQSSWTISSCGHERCQRRCVCGSVLIGKWKTLRSSGAWPKDRRFCDRDGLGQISFSSGFDKCNSKMRFEGSCFPIAMFLNVPQATWLRPKLETVTQQGTFLAYLILRTSPGSLELPEQANTVTVYSTESQPCTLKTNKQKPHTYVIINTKNLHVLSFLTAESFSVEFPNNPVATEQGCFPLLLLCWRLNLGPCTWEAGIYRGFYLEAVTPS